MSNYESPKEKVKDQFIDYAATYVEKKISLVVASNYMQTFIKRSQFFIGCSGENLSIKCGS
jgi:hypothetical protein